MRVITGRWSNADGSPAFNGRVFFTLTQDAIVVGGPELSSNVPIAFQLDANGSLPANTRIWFSDEMTRLVLYSVSVLGSGGGLLYGSEYFLPVGAGPLDVSNMIPALFDLA